MDTKKEEEKRRGSTIFIKEGSPKKAAGGIDSFTTPSFANVKAPISKVKQ